MGTPTGGVHAQKVSETTGLRGKAACLDSGGLLGSDPAPLLHFPQSWLPPHAALACPSDAQFFSAGFGPPWLSPRVHSGDGSPHLRGCSEVEMR